MPERLFCETETSSPVITFLCIYKRVVSDDKYYILFLYTCLHYLKVRMRCTDDGRNKGPNHVATLLKSDSCVGRNISLFTDTLLTIQYNTIKPLQKSENFVQSLGSAHCHFVFSLFLFYYKLTRICTHHYCVLLAFSSLNYLLCVLHNCKTFVSNCQNIVR